MTRTFFSPVLMSAATGCAGCGVVGLGDVLANYTNICWQEH